MYSKHLYGSCFNLLQNFEWPDWQLPCHFNISILCNVKFQSKIQVPPLLHKKNINKSFHLISFTAKQYENINQHRNSMRIINLCFIEHIQLKKQLNVLKNIT